MPSRSGAPDPLAGLPRPLADRERRPSRTRRALTLGLVAGVLGAGAFAVATSVPLDGIGQVAGVIAVAPDGEATAAPGRTPEPAPVAAIATPTPTPRPTPTPIPTPTPAATPIPIGLLAGYQWPLPRGRLTLPFGPTHWGSRIVDGEKFHDGIDLATFCGDRIVAAHAGRVLSAGRHYDAYMGWVGDLQPYLDRLEKNGLYGTLPIVVVIDDGNGYRSIYAHFSKVVVKKGQEVQAGEFLGYEGMTGRASGCHLHYGLFSPLETATFGIDPDVVKRMKLPDQQIARVDPLIVLPERPTPTKKPTPTPALTPPP